MQAERSPHTGAQQTPERAPDPITVDAERPFEESDEAGEVTPPLEAPIETPIPDLVEQRRSVRLDEPDDH